MSNEHKVKLLLDYISREERFLKDLKGYLEEQLLRLQIQEATFLNAAKNLKKKAETVNGIEGEKKPKIKTEPLSPEHMTTSNTEILESSLSSIFKNENSDEEAQDLLILNTDEIADVL